MLGSSVAFILLTFQLILCVSAGRTIVKRKAPEGKLYVFFERDGCKSVVSEEPCSLSWPLNPLHAKTYEQQNDVVKLLMKQYDILRIYSDDCKEAMKNSLCSQAVPRCSTADNSVDYGDVLNECRKNVYMHCPQNVKQGRFCENLNSGKHTKVQCVAPSSRVGGICPQPKYKMPEDFLASYRKSSEALSTTFKPLENVKYSNGERVYSSKCVSLLKEMSCTQYYCSADESKILIEYDRSDCNELINECFDDIFLKLSKHPSSVIRSLVENMKKSMQSTCRHYPKASAAGLQVETAAVINTAAKCVHTAHHFIFLLVAFIFVKIII